MAKKKASKSVRSKRGKASASDTTGGRSGGYTCSVYPPKELHPKFARSLAKLESELEVPVVLLWQDGKQNNPAGTLNHDVCAGFMEKIDTFPASPVAVLLGSPGGYGDAAYRRARHIQRRCGKYTVVVPYMAKSAATLFALGAEKILMGRFAELGPLDAQIHDFEREESRSALEVVQSVERLNREAMSAMDQQMLFWLRRSGKKIETLLPVVSHFVAEMMAPLFDKVDAVDFTKNARMLKVAQDYAVRLLRNRLGQERAEHIASALTNEYSEHGFVIDADEAARVGLPAEKAKGTVGNILDDLALSFVDQTALGLFGRAEL